jgi:acyl-coenzyme A thioesterase PaaI-like protein
MTAFQDFIANNHCFGCGPDNPHGLRIKSFWQEPGVAICHFHAEPHHCSAPRSAINGGIIASVIDCHAVGTAIAACYLSEGREPGSGEAILCVTGELNVRYLKPARIDTPLAVTARVVELGPKKIRLACEARSGELLCATADVLAIRVPAQWGEI